MAKSNGQPGSVVAYATYPVKYEGTVTSVTDLGVTIQTRAYGKQTDVGRFFATKDIVAHTDEGVGFVVVNENRAIETTHGDVAITEQEIVVTLENGRAVSFLPDTEAANIQVHFDTEDGKQTSTEANIGKRNSAKLITAIGRREEKNGGAAKVKKPKKKK